MDSGYNDSVDARVVLHPEKSRNAVWINEWLVRCEEYLRLGYRVYFMMHCPNNQHCPAFAEQFHASLCREVPGLAALPPWPVPQQAGLF